MNIQKLLVADHSPVLVEELTRRLNGTFLIRSCTDGNTAQRLLESFQPDVVVLDTMLSGVDGIALVQRVANLSPRPAILLTTLLVTPFVEHLAIQSKVDYIMTKPCDLEVLTDRVCEIAGYACGDIFIPEMEDLTVRNMLLALNVSLNHKGFAYLNYGIEWYRQHPGESITGALYPAISRRFNASQSAVEHNIRRAIDAAWRSGNQSVWKIYFSQWGGYTPRPTNTTFIATLAHRCEICMNQKTQQNERIG